MSTATTTSTLPAPPGNFAAHVIALNSGRADKLAYIDDEARLTYGALADSIQRMAAALLALGLRREERVLLLAHDCNDWPVAFLGALYAGIVPVAVNTLLTAEDYAYMLQHSRAQAVVVSAALLPVLVSAREIAAEEGGDEIRAVIVSGAPGELPAGCLALPA
ncbi:MAG TPA: AMP-binding protein, partial [Rubrivivax sp.]|nr:AMP-binding protein [Rubrivivax sp.]